MNYFLLFTLLTLSSSAYSWLYSPFGFGGLGYGLGGYYGLGYGLGGYYGLGFGGWRNGFGGWWGKRDSEFIPRVDCVYRQEKNTLVCNG